VVGVSSYGRSFNMASSGCFTSNCLFTGPAGQSDANPGRCTGTAGYISNAEILEIAADRSRTRLDFIDQDSNSRIVVYDSNQWVAFMDESIRNSRASRYQGLSMGGTTNWAIDLEAFHEAPNPQNSWPAFKLAASTSVSIDGSCGANNGGASCIGSGFGDCCSSSGRCGSTDAYCGSGCQGGSCIIGGVTTDGTCGAAHNGFTCKGWMSGPCCSADGYCGSSDEFCLVERGCQSGCFVPPTGNPEYSYSPPDPTKNCNTIGKWLAIPEAVGNFEGGTQFCAAKWNAGVFPNMIKAGADGENLRYLLVGFNDGTNAIYGKTEGAESSRTGVISWDPWTEHFSTFSEWAGGWDNGLTRIHIEMDGRPGVDSGGGHSNPAEHAANRGPKGEGMLLGFFGASGDNIDALQPLFSKSAPDKVKMNDYTFTPSFEELNKRNFRYTVSFLILATLT
jgi:hypothetical protein